MSNVIRKLNLIEELESTGLSNNLIESIIEAEEHDLDVAFVCNTEEELDAALKAMSSEETLP